MNERTHRPVITAAAALVVAALTVAGCGSSTSVHATGAAATPTAPQVTTPTASAVTAPTTPPRSATPTAAPVTTPPPSAATTVTPATTTAPSAATTVAPATTTAPSAATTVAPATTPAPSAATTAAPVPDITGAPNPSKYIDEPDTGPIRIGMHGRRTGVLQTMLVSTGDLQGAVDGYFGSGTDRGVRLTQARHQLPITGIVDDATWHVLDVDTGGAIYPNIQAAVAAATAMLTTGNGAGGWMGVDLGNLFQVAQPGLATWSYGDTRATSADYVLAGDGGVYSTLTIEFIPFGAGYAYDGISSLQGH